MKRKYLIALITVSFVITFDQITKYLIYTRMTIAQTIELIPGFLSLHYLTNPAAAFGLFRNMNEHYRGVFFICVGLVALGMVIFYLVQSDDEKIYFPFSLALVMGGALGNLIDRIRLGHVTDFVLLEATFMGDKVVKLFDHYCGGHYWPSFNVSDSAIVVGIIGMAIDLLFFTKEEPEKTADDSPQATA